MLTYTGPQAAAGAAGYTGPEAAVSTATDSAAVSVAAGLVTLDLRFRLVLSLELTKPLPSALRQLLWTPPPVC